MVKEFNEYLNLFVTRAISQLHTDRLHKFLQVKQYVKVDVSDVDFGETTTDNLNHVQYKEFNSTYTNEMNNLGQSLTKLIDPCFNSSNSIFAAIQASRLVMSIIMVVGFCRKTFNPAFWHVSEKTN